MQNLSVFFNNTTDSPKSELKPGKISSFTATVTERLAAKAIET